MYKRLAALFLKRCIVKRRMYRPGFAVYITLGRSMATIRRITQRDDPVKLAQVAAKHQVLLTEALEIAKRNADGKPQLVRDILATGTVEGLATNLNSKAAAVCYRAEKYKRSWHSLIPWQNLEHTTAEDEAESMIQTVETNVQMTETNSWPPLPSDPKKTKARK